MAVYRDRNKIYLSLYTATRPRGHFRQVSALSLVSDRKRKGKGRDKPKAISSELCSGSSSGGYRDPGSRDPVPDAKTFPFGKA